MSQGLYVIDMDRTERRRCHPGGDRGGSLGENRAEAIIRVMTSVAGYRHHYPFMSNSPHNGLLTRPETLASPVHRAIRERKLEERHFRFPAAKRDREHWKRLTRADWIRERAKMDRAPKKRQIGPGYIKEEVNIPTNIAPVNPDVDSVPSQHSSSHGVIGIKDRILKLARKLSCKTKEANITVEPLGQVSQLERGMEGEISKETDGVKPNRPANEQVDAKSKPKIAASPKAQANAFSRFARRIQQKITRRNA